MSNFRLIWFTAQQPDIQVYMFLGARNPVITDGYGGWQVTDRPHRKGLTTWAGRNPFRQVIDVVMSEFKTGDSIEKHITTLQTMAEPVILTGVKRTPIIRIHGDALTHKDTNYVIENLEWGDTERNQQSGDRIRQLATVSLLEFVDGDLIDEKKSAPGSGNKYVIYTIKRGDTLQSIAKKLLNDSSRWKQLARLNNIHDPRNLTPGRKIRVPRT